MAAYLCGNLKLLSLKGSITLCLLNRRLLNCSVGACAMVSNIDPFGCSYTHSHIHRKYDTQDEHPSAVCSVPLSIRGISICSLAQGAAQYQAARNVHTRSRREVLGISSIQKSAITLSHSHSHKPHHHSQSTPLICTTINSFPVRSILTLVHLYKTFLYPPHSP